MKQLPLIVSRIYDPFLFIVAIICVGSVRLSTFSAFKSASLALILLGIFVCYFLVSLKRGSASNYDVTDRKERYKLYVVGLTLSGILVGLYWRLGELKLAHYAAAMVFVGLVFAGITRWWKISFHVGIQGYTAAVAVLFYGFSGYLCIFNLFLVGWARVKGKYHTLAQAMSGGVLGFVLGRLLLK